MKRILIISEAHLIQTFLLSTIKQLKKETDIVFDCFIITPIESYILNSLKDEFEHVYVNEFPNGFLRKIPKIRFFQMLYGLRKLAHSLPDFDIAHIHFNYSYLAFCASVIRKKTRKFYITYFGSDFNHHSYLGHLGNKYTIQQCDGIFVTNGTLLKSIDKRYNLSSLNISKDIQLPLMESLITFESFLERCTQDKAKENLGIPKPIIVCGYNAAPITRHTKIIDALVSIKDKISEFKIIFPMTYGLGAEETRTTVKKTLGSSSLDFIVLGEFLSIEKLQNLRLAADIFIHIQAKDQLASSMLEHLAAGSVVITGNWLPYDSLIEKGVYFIRIDSPDDLAKTIVEVIGNLEEHRRRSVVNRRIILNMMSWENIKLNWYKYYELEPKA